MSLFDSKLVRCGECGEQYYPERGAHVCPHNFARVTATAARREQAEQERSSMFASELDRAMEREINSPPHYTAGAVECIDALRAVLGPQGFRAYCLGNVIKYLWRAEHKGGTQDMKKALWYMRMLLGDDPRKDAAVGPVNTSAPR